MTGYRKKVVSFGKLMLHVYKVWEEIFRKHCWKIYIIVAYEVVEGTVGRDGLQ